MRTWIINKLRIAYSGLRIKKEIGHGRDSEKNAKGTPQPGRLASIGKKLSRSLQYAIRNTQYVIRNTQYLLPLAFLASAAFLALDAFWLKSLPVLELSFGPATPAWIIFGLARGGILAAWLCAWSWRGWRRPAPQPANWLKLLLATHGFVLILGLYGFFIEPHSLTIGQVELQTAAVERRLRIVQLTDTHVERATRRELELPQRVAELKPDLIVLTGDYLNTSYSNDPIAVRDLRAMIAQLHAPLGIYAVDGTVEDPERVRELFAGLDVRVLDNEIVPLPTVGPGFTLVGLSNRYIPEDTLVLKRLMASLPRGGYTLLLYHNPDQAYVAQEAGVDLYLAGHTHGGQVRMPFYGALLTASHFGKTFEQGLYPLGNMRLYVSRGIGLEGSLAPRVRFLAPPEITVIDLVPEGSAR